MFLGKYFTLWMVIVHFQSSSVYASVKDLTGLVRYYTGDNTLADSSGITSGTENDLNVQNGRSIEGTARYETIATTPFSSKPRAVFELNGSVANGYHLRGTNTGLPLANSARSIMGWVRIDQLSLGYWAHIFAYGNSGTSHSFDFSPHDNGVLEFDNYGGGDESMAPLLADYRPFLGIWKHYTFTYHGPTLKFYVDGVLTKEGNISTLNTLSGDISVGANVHYGTNSFYGAAAEIAVFNRALTPTEISMIASTDTASGGGDPHFLGFGGIAFTWQGHCDSILTMTSNIRDIEDNIHVHIRTRKVRKWSAIDVIAFKIGNEVGEIGSEEAKLIHNGIEKESINSEKLSVVKSFDKKRKKVTIYNIIFNKDKQLEAKVNTRTKMIYVTLSGNFPEETVGLLGSPHKPGLYSRNGTLFTEKEINKYSESWQVRDTDPQLFQQRRFPQYPETCLYQLPNSNTRTRRLQQRKAITMEEATRACVDHTPGPLKDFCIDDVIGTADVDVAKDTFYG